MQLQKMRWSNVYESPEEELVEFLRARNITATRFDVDMFNEFSNTVSQDTTLWCAEGSMNVQAGGKSFSLQPGDFLRVPAQNTYKAIVGMSGSVYYESVS